MEHYPCILSLFRVFSSHSICLTLTYRVFLCLCQFARNNVGLPVRTRGSVATTSALVAAPNPTMTCPAPPVSTTTTRVGVSQTVPQAPTSLRAGAALPWNCALKCIWPAIFTLSSTMESVCSTVPLASHVTRLIGKDESFILTLGPDHLEIPW